MKSKRGKDYDTKFQNISKKLLGAEIGITHYRREAAKLRKQYPLKKEK